MNLTAIIVAALALSVPPPGGQAAMVDWHAQSKEDQYEVRYLTLDPVPAGKHAQWEKVIKYAIPAASRAENVDRQVPQQLGNTPGYRIDIRSLQWGEQDLIKVLEKYPYTKFDPKRSLLIIRADWLVNELADTRDSDAYYRLIYGGAKIPKTDAELFKFWGVDLQNQQGAQFGWIETKSQVSLQNTRLVEHFVGRASQHVWRTKDMFQVIKGKDPFEFLDGSFQHDGREIIVQVVKSSFKNKSRGSSQVYALANGQGGIVNEAPVRLVEDHKRTLGQTAIVNNASCVVCHSKGMNFPTENGLEESLKSGVQLFVYSKGKLKVEEIENYYLSDAFTTLRRNNEDFASFVFACNGLEPEANAKLYWGALEDYRADLDLNRAANELYCRPEDLKLALGYASANDAVLTARVAGLAHGKKVTRDTFAEAYLELGAQLKKWVAKR